MGEVGPAAGAVSAGMTALWERFHGAILDRVTVVEEAAVALLGGALDDALRRHAEREAHKLAGSVGTFGFAEASRLARSLELTLAGDAPLAAADALRLAEGAEALRAMLDVPAPPGPEAAPPPEAERPLLLLVGADGEMADRVAVEAEARGMAVRRAGTPAEAEGALDGAAPAGVLLDLGGEPAAGAALALLERLALHDPPPRMVVLSERDTLAARVEAALRGGAALLRRPASPAAVAELLLRGPGGEGLAGARVMVVDDDPQVLAAVAALLAEAGVEVVQVGDPARFWGTLRRMGPDLVILDHDMPAFSGVELCRALRADPRWWALPVLFLSARRDAESVRRMFSAGADDYVAKPVVGAELTARIRNRLERARLNAALAGSAGPGGLPGRERAAGEAERLLQLAARRGEVAGVVRLGPDAVAPVRAALGHAGAEEALARAAARLRALLPPGDLAAWWGGEQLLAVCYGEDAEGSAALFRGIVARLGRAGATPDGAPLTFSAGVAALPADGTSLAALVARAEAAQARACGAGVGRVAVASEAAGRAAAEHVDVVLVEDDRVLAELLEHALATRGYRVRVLRDGGEAVEALAGDAPALRGRVVLLDVDLPGKSGLTVLRALARSGVLERTRCVMLTVRSSEEEVLKTLEMGAADHVAKPFSVAVLLERVRRLLEQG